jgi:hypothetical protein
MTREGGVVTSHTDETQVLAVDERAELERLREEVARLREQSAEGPPEAPQRDRSVRRWWRSLLAILLIVVAAILAPVSVASVWARSLITDTNRYVDTVAPLAQDPAVQQAITDNLTNLVFQYVDVQGITTQAVSALQQRDIVPPALASQLQGLAVPLANGVRSFTQDKVHQVVQSDAFAQAWEQANRTAHEQLVAALSGQGGAVTVQGNAVKVDLAAFLSVVKQKLVESGFQLAAKIPQVNATFTVFQSSDISKVQRGFNLLNTLGYWFPFVLAAIAGLGIYLARNHRLAFIGAGVGAAVAMTLTAIGLALARSAYLNSVPPNVISPDAAAVMFDTVVRFLRDAVRSLALIGIIVALGAFLAGPSVAAVVLRRGCVNAFASAKGGAAELGLRMHPVTSWVAPKARVIRAVIVAVAFAVLLLVQYKTPGLVLWLTVAVLAALAVVEFLAVDPRARRPAGTRAVVPAPVQV